MRQVKLKQFIYGKYINKKYQDYGIIAKTINISDDEIKKTRSLFQGSQPLSVELPEFQGAWLISPLDNDYIVVLRQEPSVEKELGRQIFLYQHYRIFLKKDFNRIHRLWLFAQEKNSQINFESLATLENYIEVNDLFFEEKINHVLKKLFSPNQKNFIEDTLTNLYILLSEQKIDIQISPQNFGEFLAAFNCLFPASKLNDYSVYIGYKKPNSWKSDICILKNNLKKLDASVLINTALSKKINLSYTKIIYKILEYDYRDWYDFPYILDTIQDIEVNNDKNLDIKLGKELFGNIGLKLLKHDIQINKVKPDELFIIWDAFSKKLEDDDVNKIFPLILNEQNFWDMLDFKGLNILVEKYYETIKNCLNNQYLTNLERFTDFINNWLNNFPSPKTVTLLSELICQSNFTEKSIIFHLFDVDESLNIKLLKKIISLNNTLNITEEYQLARNILKKARNASQIEEINQLLSKYQDLNLSKIIINLLFSSLNSKYVVNFETYIISLKSWLSTLAFKDNLIGNILLFAINFEDKKILDAFKSDWQFSNKILSNISTDNNQKIKNWIKKSNSDVVNLFYITILYSQNNVEQAKEFMTDIIIENIEKYKSLAKAFKETKEQKKYSMIKFEKLDQLDIHKKTKIIIDYLNISELLLHEEIDFYKDFFLSLSDDFSLLKELDKVYPIFQKEKEYEICQLILELQIRNAIINKNQKFFKQRISTLKSFSKQKNNFLRNRITSDYLTALSKIDKKEDYLQLFFIDPSLILKSPEIINKAPITSILFKNNLTKILDDIDCRIILFEWVNQELSNKKLKGELNVK